MNEVSTKPKLARKAAESAARQLGDVKDQPQEGLDLARKELEAVGRDAAATEADEFYMPRTRMGALVQSAMAKRMAAPDAGQEDLFDIDLAFSDVDPGWATVLPSLIEKWLTKDADFRTHNNVPVQFSMANQTKVALFSDWGTGRPAADAVMAQLTSRGPNIMIHLGDIYYSGQPFEAEERFLDHLPKGPGSPRKFALNGNHEMYSGGHGYFDTVLPKMENRGSYFCISNDHWRLIGLDSAYKDKRLQDPQLKWLTDLVKPNDGRRNILLSHHQAFSMFEEVDPKDLWEPMKPLIDAGKIHAWFWGHEHKLVGFKKYHGLVARCIGHGAIPYAPPGRDFSEQTFSDLAVKFVNRRRRNENSLQAVNGFAQLRFNGTDLEADYIDEDGTTRTESISNILDGISD